MLARKMVTELGVASKISTLDLPPRQGDSLLAFTTPYTHSDYSVLHAKRALWLSGKDPQKHLRVVETQRAEIYTKQWLGFLHEWNLNFFRTSNSYIGSWTLSAHVPRHVDVIRSLVLRLELPTYGDFGEPLEVAVMHEQHGLQTTFRFVVTHVGDDFLEAVYDGAVVLTASQFGSTTIRTRGVVDFSCATLRAIGFWHREAGFLALNEGALNLRAEIERNVLSANDPVQLLASLASIQDRNNVLRWRDGLLGCAFTDCSCPEEVQANWFFRDLLIPWAKLTHRFHPGNRFSECLVRLNDRDCFGLGFHGIIYRAVPPDSPTQSERKSKPFASRLPLSILHPYINTDGRQKKMCAVPKFIASSSNPLVVDQEFETFLLQMERQHFSNLESSANVVS